MFKRFSKPLIATLMAFCAPWFTLTAFGEDYIVALNKTQILHLPVAAGAVVVGNPEIADVSVHSPNTIFVLGRGYGQTNIIVLDEFGQTVLDADITVKDTATNNSIHLYNVGVGRQTYNCTPNCLPAPILGDTRQFIALHRGQRTTINNATIAGTLSTPNAANIQNLQVPPGNSPQLPPQQFRGEPSAQSLAPPRQQPNSRSNNTPTPEPRR